MRHEVILGSRRFTCLAPTLVRLEFAPDGRFEDRRSMVAYAARTPLPFANVTVENRWTILDTGAMQLVAKDHDQAFDRLNLEIRWNDGKLLQIWRPGDTDYQNLGGILRSLDRYGGEACRLDGVHPAGMASPDPFATNWPAWIQCEIDPLYTTLHPRPPEALNHGHWLRVVEAERNDGRYMHHTFNWYKVARQFSPGVLSASGYFLLNDSDSAVMDADDFPVERRRPGCQDWYFFAYGSDYRQALRDFRLLSGPAPLPTHRSFGIIFSRWPAFTETEIRAMVRDFAANGYPLSTLVMDMEWHKEGWGHWEFNPDLIPDPAAFFALCKQHGLEVTFNDHPLDVREDDIHFNAYVSQAGPDVEIRERVYNDKTLRMAKVDICNKQQNAAFREVCHRAIMELGLDYWWNDGSRGQMIGTSGQLVCNKTLFEESERDGRRGMLLSRHGGLGSHRYGGFFTGDANSDWEVLRLQVELNVRAAGVGVGHISHDIGGFMIPQRELTKNAAGTVIIDPVRYVRWLQFGVFNPILRFHCAPGSGSRLPYDYDTETGGACRHWLRVRHSLLPYIYTAARTYSDTGIPPTLAVYLDEPDNPAAYRFDEYRFGPSLLVAPMVENAATRTLYLPGGAWWRFETADRAQGGREHTVDVPLDDYPVFVKAGAILPRRNPDGDLHSGHIAELWLDVYPGADGEADLYEDDGFSVAYRAPDATGFCRTRFALRDKDQTLTLSGTIVEGRPLGATRSVTVTVALDIPPKRVTDLTGRTLDCSATGTPGRYRIVAPDVRADEPFTLTLHLG